MWRKSETSKHDGIFMTLHDCTMVRDWSWHLWSATQVVRHITPDSAVGAAAMVAAAEKPQLYCLFCTIHATSTAAGLLYCSTCTAAPVLQHLYLRVASQLYCSRTMCDAMALATRCLTIQLLYKQEVSPNNCSYFPAAQRPIPALPHTPAHCASPYDTEQPRCFSMEVEPCHPKPC
jgi:hypothetical protein